MLQAHFQAALWGPDCFPDGSLQESVCGRPHRALRRERRLEAELQRVPQLPQARLQPTGEE